MSKSSNLRNNSTNFLSKWASKNLSIFNIFGTSNQSAQKLEKYLIQNINKSHKNELRSESTTKNIPKNKSSMRNLKVNSLLSQNRQRNKFFKTKEKVISIINE